MEEPEDQGVGSESVVLRNGTSYTYPTVTMWPPKRDLNRDSTAGLAVWMGNISQGRIDIELQKRTIAERGRLGLPQGEPGKWLSISKWSALKSCTSKPI